MRPVSQMRYEPSRELHEVWMGNLNEEFNSLLAAVSRAGGPEAILALDMEFPGFPCEDPRFSSPEVHYQALRCNIDQLWPIQLGIAVASAKGVNHGVWTFNIRFDADVDAHTEESMAFLRAAGIDFPRHRTEGIDALALGRRLVNSSLVGPHGCAPCWLTFSGSYDWGYLLKLVTLGRVLPKLPGTFDKVISAYCPKRRELRDLLPNGSLEALGRKHGVKRWGCAHTAGSDALLTLELYMLLGGPELQPDLTSKFGEVQEREQWGEQWAEMDWQNVEQWYPNGADQWYPGDNSGMQAAWENSTWTPPVQANNDWFSPSVAPARTGSYQLGLVQLGMVQSKSPAWHPYGFHPWVTAL